MRRRRQLVVFGALALGAHLVLFTVVRLRHTEEDPDRHLAGRFVKRRPVQQQSLRRLLSVPRASPRLRRAIAMPQAFARASAPRQRAAAIPDVLSGGLQDVATPRRLVTMGYGVPQSGRLSADPVAVAVADAGQISLGLELLDTEALDTGRYRALVVWDRSDRRRMQGYVHVAAVTIGSALEAAENSVDNARLSWYLEYGALEVPDWRRSADVRSLAELTAEVEAQTGLVATVDQGATLAASSWMDSPIVLLTAAADFVPTTREVEHLGRYLTSGGFAYVEVVGTNSFQELEFGYARDLKTLRGLVEGALTGQGLQRGRDWDISPLPMSHPVFSCYNEVVTMPRHYWSVMQSLFTTYYGDVKDNIEQTGWLTRPEPELEGIFVKGRLAGIYSENNYRDMWARRVERALVEGSEQIRHTTNQHVGPRFPADPALRLGVNIVVYALTQEGGLARQLVTR